MRKKHIKYRKDGSVLAIGYLQDGKRDGYWKWYRKDKTKLKTGYFKDGKRIREWMMYDKKGNPSQIRRSYKILNCASLLKMV